MGKKRSTILPGKARALFVFFRQVKRCNRLGMVDVPHLPVILQGHAVVQLERHPFLEKVRGTSQVFQHTLLLCKTTAFQGAIHTTSHTPF